jgi:hypothetical protein
MKLLKPTITYIYTSKHNICRKYNDQQTMQWPTDNTMTNRQYLSVGHCIVCWSLYCLLITVLSVGHCIVCWLLYCLLVIVLSVGHCIKWPTDGNTMTNRQYNDQQTIQWPADNTMTNRQYNDQQTIQWPKEIKGTKEQTMIYKTLIRKLKIGLLFSLSMP